MGRKLPRGVPYKEKYVFFLPGDRYLAPIGVKMCMMVELCPIHGFLHFWWRYLEGSPNVSKKWYFVHNLSSAYRRRYVL